MKKKMARIFTLVLSLALLVSVCVLSFPALAGSGAESTMVKSKTGEYRLLNCAVTTCLHNTQTPPNPTQTILINDYKRRA